MALSMFLLRRDGRAALLLVIAAALHPTATAWFVVWLGVAVWVARPRWRRAILAVAGAGINTRGQASYDEVVAAQSDLAFDPGHQLMKWFLAEGA